MNKPSRSNLPKNYSLLQQPSLESLRSSEERAAHSASSGQSKRGVAIALILGLLLLQVVTLAAALSIVWTAPSPPIDVPAGSSSSESSPVAVLLPTQHPSATVQSLIPSEPTAQPTASIPPTATPIPSPTSLPAPVWIRGVELTQGIQVLQEPENSRCHPDPGHPHHVLCNNSIPMVAGRHTMLRVYLTCNPDCPTADTTLSLRLLKEDQAQQSLAQEISIGDLQRVNTLSLAQLRGDLNNSVNFTFLPPPDWMLGQITFELEALPHGETTLPPDRYSLTKEFVERKPLRVAYLPIDYDGLRPPEPQDIGYWLLRMYPVPDVEYFRLPMPDMTWEGEISKGEVLRKLLYTYWVYGQYRSNEAHPDQLFGWLPNEVYNGGAADPFWCPGCAGPHSSRVAFGGLRPEQDIGGPRILVHEIAHNLGAQHAWSPTAGEDAGCFKTEGADIQVDPNWPYDFNPNIQEFGIDLYSNPPVIYPPSVYDMMSYCTQPWISPHTYRKIFDSPFLQPGSAAPEVPPEYLTQIETTNAGTLMVSGVVYPDGTVSRPEIIRLEGEPLDDAASFMPPQPAGDDYCLDVWGQDNQKLAQRCFDAGFADLEHGEPTDSSAFLFLLPDVDPAAVSKVTVSRDDEALVEVSPSHHAPTVQVLYPTDGTTLHGRQTITWQADDADGDRLSYDILYSADDGQSWQPLAIQLSSMEYTFYTSQIPAAGLVRLRVTATDGFHSTTAELPATFAVQTSD